MYYKNNMGLRLEPFGMPNVLNGSLDLQSFSMVGLIISNV